MRKTLIFLTIFAIVFCYSTFNIEKNIFVDAKNEDEIKKNMEEQIDKNISSLITSDLEQYFNELNVANGRTLKDFIKDVINGKEVISLETFFNVLFTSFKNGLKSSLISVISIIVLAILSSLFGHLSSGFKKDGTKNVIHLAIYSSIICTIIYMIIDVVSVTTKSLNTLKNIIDISFPIIITLLSALGGTQSIGLFEPFTIFFSTIIIKIINYFIIPMFFAALIFTFVSNLNDTIKLEKFSKTIKSICNWTLGIIFSLLTSTISIQGIVGSGIDTITFKFSKFALSSYVPILGGYLAEGFDIVLASCVLIKNAFGLSLFLIIASIMITPIFKIFILSISLKIVASFIEPIGEQKLSSLCYNTASNLNILIASLGGVTFIVFVMLLLTIGSFNGGMV